MIRGLYAITPECADTRILLSMVDQAVSGGASIVQYRSKHPDRGLRLDQARRILNLCGRHGVPCIVNDDLELAIECGADGVHIGKGDGSVQEAKRRLGNRIVGASCYNRMDLALDATIEGADYIAFGSFYPSTTKPGAVKASLELLQIAKLSIKIPVVAIGGITWLNAREPLASGADAIAVISALFDAPDIRMAAEQFSELFLLQK